MIVYQHDLDGVATNHLQGFFEGWPNPPSPETHLRLLQGSDMVVLARLRDSRQVIGFITAITDGVLSAYIPHLEVLPEHRGRGIGSDLLRIMHERLESYYMVDLTCNEHVRPFYERFGMRPARAMVFRRLHRQSGDSRVD